MVPPAGDDAISHADVRGPLPGRLLAADVLRALATVLVVLIHTTHWPYHAPVFDAVDRISRIAVPAFMMLTGVLLSYQYGSDRVALGPFLGRRFSRSLLPWFLWAPLYAATGWLFTGDVRHSAGDLGTFFSYGAGHLWFLLLIPQMYLLFLVWPHSHLWLWAGAAIAVQVALSIYRLYGTMPTSAVEQLTLWHGFQLLPFWVGYFAVGLAAGRTLRSRGAPTVVRWRPALLVGAAVAVSCWLLFVLDYRGAPHEIFQTGTGGFLLPQEPLFVFSVAALVLIAAPWFRATWVVRLVRLLSDHSLGIYILHPIIVFPIASLIYGALLARAVPLSLLGFVLLSLAALLVATSVSALLGTTLLAPTLGLRRRPGSWRRPGGRRQPTQA